MTINLGRNAEKQLVGKGWTREYSAAKGRNVKTNTWERRRLLAARRTRQVGGLPRE